MDKTVDVELIKSVSITNYKLETANYTVYPNPTTGKLSVVSSQLSEMGGEVVIYGVVGQVVFTSALSSTSTETTIDISHLANGMYFLKIDGKTFKVIKHNILR